MTPILRLPILLLALPLFAQNADLRVQPEPPTARTVPIGAHVQPRFSVVNGGADAAPNARVSIVMSDGVTLEYAYLEGTGYCAQSGNVATCELGDLAAGASRSIGVEADLPVEIGTYSITASAGSETADPRDDNNAATWSYTTEQLTALSAGVFPRVVRATPGALVPIRAFLSNYVATMPGTRFTAELSVTRGTIERIDATDWQCDINGATARCTIVASSRFCCSELVAQVRTDPDRAGGETVLTIHGAADVPGRYDGDASSTVEVYRHILVTTTADSGPGSLRAAFDDVNAHCHGAPCKVDFAIDEPLPAEGWFTIVPESPLPVIEATHVILDGSAQTRLTGDKNPNGPEVAIDGRRIGVGLEIHATCDAIVSGLALGHFDRDQALSLTGRPGSCKSYLERFDRFAVTGNHIGVDPSGTAAWPNLRGLRLDGAERVSVTGNLIRDNVRSGIWMWNGSGSVTDNRIEANGASGIFAGPAVSWFEVLRNRIDGHPEMGVAVARGAKQVDIRQNSMHDNGGLGIDWGLDGPTPETESQGGPANAPLLLAARYDAASDKTLVTMSLRSVPLATFGRAWVINLYANEGPDGDGEQPVAEVTFGNSLPGEILTAAAPGDLTGKWINATSTRVHWLDPLRDSGVAPAYLTGETWTSELSNSVLAAR
ncbi:MAG TPA: right-handed parallel beta-helix repeat-containing protein [Thermoanaerobaculia bacterium]|nr:right-handed parallel beta-helix repeat-containing protein [Thermoanaerobaculia bacterium]